MNNKELLRCAIERASEDLHRLASAAASLGITLRPPKLRNIEGVKIQHPELSIVCWGFTWCADVASATANWLSGRLKTPADFEKAIREFERISAWCARRMAGLERHREEISRQQEKYIQALQAREALQSLGL